jgi:alkylhydroperoxidase family enzyme
MTYLSTPAESPLYDNPLARLGYIPNWARVFALTPDAYQAWTALLAAIKAGMDERRFQLVPLTAARALSSRYCTLAYVATLSEKFFDDTTLAAILADRHNAGLDPADVAAMDFAERIAANPADAAPADIDAMHHSGLSDVDIMWIVLAVMARRFFSGTLDAVAAQPDDSLLRVDHLVSQASAPAE